MTVPGCAYCDRLATTTVHAQWSIFDFDEREACDEHVRIARIHFWNRLVDGARPVDLWVTRWYADKYGVTVFDSP